MKKSFVFGVVAGVSALAIAVPLVAQISSAQSVSSGNASLRSTPSVACVQAMADAEGVRLAAMDAMHQAHKAALQVHSAALQTAAAITDDAQRQEAIGKANEDLRTAMQAARDARGDPKEQRDALQAACGNAGFRGLGVGMGGGFMGMKGPRGMGMHGKGGKMGGMGGGCPFRDSAYPAQTEGQE